MRVCIEDGCPTLTKATRCTDHARARDRARGTRQARGYDAEHDTLRAIWQRRIDSGEAINCWRCEQPIVAPWHLGHCDSDRSKYHGPEHESCNTGTSGRTSCTHPDHARISPRG